MLVLLLASHRSIMARSEESKQVRVASELKKLREKSILVRIFAKGITIITKVVVCAG